MMVSVIAESVAQREIFERCQRFGVEPRGDTWLIMAAGWLSRCAVCDATAELHWDGSELGGCPQTECSGFVKRVLWRRDPTPVDVLRFIGTVLDAT